MFIFQKRYATILESEEAGDEKKSVGKGGRGGGKER